MVNKALHSGFNTQMSLKKKIIIVFLTIFVVFNEAFSYYISQLSYFDECLIIIFGFLFFIKISKTKEIKYWLLALFIIFFSIDGILSYYLNSLNFGSFLNTILSNFQMIKVFLLIFFIANLNFSLKFLDYCVYALKFVGSVNAFFIVGQVFLYKQWTNLFHYQFVSETTRFLGIAGLQGLYYFPGVSGSVYLFTTIICYVQWKKTNCSKFFWEFLIFGILALVSMRAKIFLAFVFLIFLVELGLPNSKNKLLKVIVGSVPLIGVVIVIFPFIYNQIFLYFNPENNTTARFLLQLGSKNLAQMYNPLGVGFGQFASEGAKNHYSQWYYILNLDKVWGLTPDSPGFATDTWWPAILGETGYLGFVLYSIMLFLILMKLYKIYQKSMKLDYANLEKYSLIAFLMGIQLIIESSAYQVFVTSPQYLIWGIFTGIVLSQELLGNRDKQSNV